MPRILVCDDDEVLISMIRFKMTRDGIGEVTSVTDGKQALSVLALENFDIVITDIHMPFHSGLELISYLRLKLGKKTPVIVLSAEGLEDTVLHAFELGANDFLAKPFSPAELAIRVRRLLS